MAYYYKEGLLTMRKLKTTNDQIQFKPIHFIVIIFVAIVIVLAVISFSNMKKPSEYGPELKIDNFSKYFREVPDDTRSSLFATLYRVVELNLAANQEPITSGATIRKDSSEKTYDKNTGVHYGSFIVDVEYVQQSFNVRIGWSDTPNNPMLSSNKVFISCLTGKQSLYGSITCQDGRDDGSPLQTISSRFPIIQDLPIKVSYYTDNYETYVSYSITYRLDEESEDITIYINDYSGNNEQAALDKIKELGYTPSAYNIVYISAQENDFGRPPANDVVNN